MGVLEAQGGLNPFEKRTPIQQKMFHISLWATKLKIQFDFALRVSYNLVGFGLNVCHDT